LPAAQRINPQDKHPKKQQQQQQQCRWEFQISPNSGSDNTTVMNQERLVHT
jgi:hypothetical protein